jgi:hypothetical protein
MRLQSVSVDLATAFRALRQTTFRCPSQLMDELVDREARHTALSLIF